MDIINDAYKAYDFNEFFDLLHHGYCGDKPERGFGPGRAADIDRGAVAMHNFLVVAIISWHDRGSQ